MVPVPAVTLPVTVKGPVPGQVLAAGTVMLFTTGSSFTVTAAEPVLSQPLASVTVTE